LTESLREPALSIAKGGKAPEAIRPLASGASGAPPDNWVKAAGLLRALRALALTFAFLLSACSSPEAGRPLGDGPGADVRNRGKPVELHAGAHPYFKTPCVTEPVECHGPLPAFGPSPPPD
jgi:hypothetical protein